MAITEGVKEALWLWGFFDDLGFEQDCVDLWCDSQSSIHLAKNQVYHARTKHINFRYHFVRVLIALEGNDIAGRCQGEVEFSPGEVNDGGLIPDVST